MPHTMFVDVLKKIQQSPYTFVNSLLQPARASKFEREKRQFIVALAAYFDSGASRGIPGDADCVLKILGGTKNDAEGGLFSTQKVSIHAESNAMRNSVHVIVRRYNCCLS